MSDAEKDAALEWLARAVSPMPIMSIGGGRQRDEEDRRHRATIMAMLAEPRLPAELMDAYAIAEREADRLYYRALVKVHADNWRGRFNTRAYARYIEIVGDHPEYREARRVAREHEKLNEGT